MNIRRVVLIFAALPLLSVIERYAYYSSRSMMALHQREALGLPRSDIGQIFLVQSATTILFLLLGGALAVLTGPAALVVAGFALMTVGHVVAAFSTGVAGIWAAALIAGIGQGLFRPALYAIAAVELRHPREQLRNSAFIGLYAAINVAALAAPASAAALGSATGTRAVFVLAAALMGFATLLALGFALLWWVFRPRVAAEPEPAPATGRVLAVGGGLLLVAVIFHALLSFSSELSYSRAKGFALSTLPLIFNINPIAVLVTSMIALAVTLSLFFLRVRLSALYVAAAGACIAATAALPLLLVPASAPALIAATVITAVAEVLFVPFALSRAAGDVPARFTPLVLGVWFAVTFGVGTLSARVTDWLGGKEALLTALFAALCFVLGAALLVAARPLARLCYEPRAS